MVEGTVDATKMYATEFSISHGGVFKDEVEVEDAEIGGTIDGTLTTRGSLIVPATGRVLGTARYRRLQVESGGQITGQLEMLTEAARNELPLTPQPPIGTGPPKIGLATSRWHQTVGRLRRPLVCCRGRPCRVWGCTGSPCRSQVCALARLPHGDGRPSLRHTHTLCSSPACTAAS